MSPRFYPRTIVPRAEWERLPVARPWRPRRPSRALWFLVGVFAGAALEALVR